MLRGFSILAFYAANIQDDYIAIYCRILLFFVFSYGKIDTSAIKGDRI